MVRDVQSYKQLLKLWYTARKLQATSLVSQPVTHHHKHMTHPIASQLSNLTGQVG